MSFLLFSPPPPLPAADFGPKGLIKYCEVNLDTNSLVVSMVE